MVLSVVNLYRNKTQTNKWKNTLNVEAFKHFGYDKWDIQIIGNVPITKENKQKALFMGESVEVFDKFGKFGEK